MAAGAKRQTEIFQVLRAHLQTVVRVYITLSAIADNVLYKVGGCVMFESKKKILIYRPTLKQQVDLLRLYSDKCDVEGTDCFTDLLAVPAAMIVLDPGQLSVEEIKQMNEVFKYDNETIIVFTCHITPRLVGVLGPGQDSIFSENMKYLVVTELEKMDIEI